MQTFIFIYFLRLQQNLLLLLLLLLLHRSFVKIFLYKAELDQEGYREMKRIKSLEKDIR